VPQRTLEPAVRRSPPDHGRIRLATAHDHAWRRVSQPGEEPGLLEGRYRCDLCAAEWAL
jgi:hypothetical protein